MKPNQTTVLVTAVWLRRIGDRVQVLIETNGEWRLAIEEHIGANFSHIAEGNGVHNWKPDEITVPHVRAPSGTLSRRA